MVTSFVALLRSSCTSYSTCDGTFLRCEAGQPAHVLVRSSSSRLRVSYSRAHLVRTDRAFFAVFFLCFSRFFSYTRDQIAHMVYPASFAHQLLYYFRALCSPPSSHPYAFTESAGSRLFISPSRSFSALTVRPCYARHRSPLKQRHHVPPRVSLADKCQLACSIREFLSLCRTRPLR